MASDSEHPDVSSSDEEGEVSEDVASDDVAEEASAEETSAEETPAEETPAEETPAEETPAEEPDEEAVPEAASSGEDSASLSQNGQKSGMTAAETEELLDVLQDMRRGDFTRRMSVSEGQSGQVAQALNNVIEQNESLVNELSRVRVSVGKQGELDQRVSLPGLTGDWVNAMNAVNDLIVDLGMPISAMRRVIDAVGRGDLSQKMDLETDGRPLRGELRRTGKTINVMVDRLDTFAGEVTRVAREVGTEGKLGGRAEIEGVSGTWEDLTDNVNSMADNLTTQVRGIAEVTTAVAEGDLSKKVTVDAKGEIAELAGTINAMVDRLDTFAGEVTRVAREVGTEGKLGGQARVPGASGTWEDLTDNVNSMADNLTTQVRGIAEVTTAVAKGDLSKKVAVDAKGEVAELADTINAMVDTLDTFAGEVTRVSREVGVEGELGGQASVPGASGTWEDLTDNVNSMADNLTTQVRGIAEVTTAVAKGDLSKKVAVDAKGEVAELADTINAMVDTLDTFAGEVTRVSREVGVEGELGGQARVPGASGTWEDLTANVNSMADNLTDQVRGIAEVTTAVAEGDLSKKVAVDAKGEVADLADTINAMVDRLDTFAGEVTRVAREVGTEGKLGGQANVPGVSGTWKDLTDNVNSMADNLTDQVRGIAEVTTAVAEGDLSKKVAVDAKGEVAELADTINEMVDRLDTFAGEVTRVAREVGTEGKLGGQARVPGASGTWEDLTDNVNSMADNLTTQVRGIAEVTTAVAEGDLSKKVAVDAKGEVADLADTINAMVDRLDTFAGEVTRVAREVGTEGKLGGQARVPGVSGTWKDLTDNVNSMADNLTDQVRGIAAVATAVADGDLSKKITVGTKGEVAELADTINAMVGTLDTFAGEVTRVAREVGTEGKLGGQAHVPGASGTWKDLTDNVNSMADNLTDQVRGIAEVTTAVAEGDLSKKVAVDAKGEIAELADTINAMVDRLDTFAGEVTRVAREVGTEGKLGGQASVPGASGTWKDLTDNVNSMADNLTDQVRGIAEVANAVAKGDLSKKVAVDAKGEIAELADTINEMVDTLDTFAGEVTRVSREVGVEGELGGQARVPGASGTWKDLTANVNSMADNLTTQVREMIEVAESVADGDFSKEITVGAAGEVAALRDSVNEMIRTLKTTTRKNKNQDWLKSNLTRVTRQLQSQEALRPLASMVLSELTPLTGARHGAFYLADYAGDEPVPADPNEDPQRMRLISAYAHENRKRLANSFEPGEGLVGQCVLEKERIALTNAPGDYVQISSGLGKSSAMNVVVVPVLFEGKVRAVLELASFESFDEIQLTFLDQLADSIGIVVNTIQTSKRTEALLEQSQQLTSRLQSQQEELTDTNQELEEQANLLKRQQEEVQEKEREIELARDAIEEKAEQLELTSKYRSEFLANMSHELRTPLNSMLILARMFAENKHGNLTEEQVEHAQAMHSSGADLLSLINEILDLSKIESGSMTAEAEPVSVREMTQNMDRLFREVAAQNNLDFSVTVEDDVPDTIETDEKRVQQVLKNLLSNALKFTDEGEVSLRVARAGRGTEHFENEVLQNADEVIAFAVSDTGAGIDEQQQNLIFEAFQQADGSAARSHGGTGLGLSISREIADLLGGELHLESMVGEGSTFTFFLPAVFDEAAVEKSRQRGDGENRRRQSFTEAVPSLDAPPASQSSFDTSNLLEIGQAEQDDEPTTDGAENANDEDGSARAAPARDVEDDREHLMEDDLVLLIVEDDPQFAHILLDAAHERGFKGVVATRGADVMELARHYAPNAITLDMRLPDEHGVDVLQRLTNDSDTRTIPVVIVSVEKDLSRQERRGAVSYLTKPTSQESVLESIGQLRDLAERRMRTLLIVEDDATQRASIAALVREEKDDVQVTSVGTGSEALQVLGAEEFDCAVVDLGLPDVDGFELIEKIRHDLGHDDLPIIVHTAQDLSEEQTEALREQAEAILLKDVSSFDQLLEETAIFLRRTDFDDGVRHAPGRLSGGNGTAPQSASSRSDHPSTPGQPESRPTEDAAAQDGGSAFSEAASAQETGEGTETARQEETEAPANDSGLLESLFGGDGNQGTPDSSPPSEAQAPREPKHPGPSQPRDSTQDLTGKEILIVDDDVQNIFALTSLLEDHGLQVDHAESGQEGIDRLHERAENDQLVDAVLMDIMMPEMDGYETTRRLRDDDRFQQLPIIAVTAKALKGDREKCIAAGASDYITKPVDAEQLLSLLRAWIPA